jgi:hypothetical protein
MKHKRSIFNKIQANLAKPKKLGRYLASPLFIEISHSSKLLVIGSGRSGTTWLSELINYDATLRFVFEPLQEDWGIKYQALKPWLYCEPQAISKQLEADINHLFFGFYRGHGMDTWNTNRWTTYCGRLVKSIRMQGLLSVVHSLLPDVKIIYIMRHPCAVLQSYYRTSWKPQLGLLIANMTQKNVIVDEHIERLSNASSTLDQYMYLWALENRVALEQLKTIPHHLCFYETLIDSPNQSISSLFNFLGKDSSEITSSHLSKPSSHASYRKNQASTSGSPIESWKHRLSADDIQRCLQITEECGLADIYTSNPLPNPTFTL